MKQLLILLLLLIPIVYAAPVEENPNFAYNEDDDWSANVETGVCFNVSGCENGWNILNFTVASGVEASNIVIRSKGNNPSSETPLANVSVSSGVADFGAGYTANYSKEYCFLGYHQTLTWNARRLLNALSSVVPGNNIDWTIGVYESGGTLNYDNTHARVVGSVWGECVAGGSPPSAPVFSGITEGTRYNSIPISITTDCSDDIFIYVNGTINSTSQPYDFYASEGYWTFNGSCVNEYGSSANTTVNIEIDFTDPVLTINDPDEINYTGTLPVDMTCTDQNPYLLNYTLFNSSFHLIVSEQDDSAPLSLSSSLDISQNSSGIYTFNTSCSDSHTDAIIPNYEVTPLPNGVEFYTDAGIRLSVQQTTPASPSWDKFSDRYSLEFGSTEIQETREFIVTSSSYIDILQNTGFNGHLATRNGNKGNWIDFNNLDTKSSVKSFRISDKSVRVQITSSDFNFHSVGGLNVVENSISMLLDSINPNSTIYISNTTPDVGDTVMIEFNCSDDYGLWKLFIAENSSGSFVNSTIIPLSGATTYNYQLNVTASGAVASVEYQGTCADYLQGFQTETVSYDIEIPYYGLDYLECPTSTELTLILWLLIMVSFAVIIIGFSTKIGFVGFFGTLMLLVSTWYISPCASIFSFILGSFGVVLMTYFVIKGFSG